MLACECSVSYGAVSLYEKPLRRRSPAAGGGPVTTSNNEAVADHVNQARDFLARSREYLTQSELHQASEKGWGAAAHMENRQLLCSSCNRIKGDRPHEYLVARLAEIGV